MSLMTPQRSCSQNTRRATRIGGDELTVNLSDMPAPPTYPTGEHLRPLLSGDPVRDLRSACRLHEEGKARQEAYDYAARAGELQRAEAPFQRVFSALAAAEESAPEPDRRWHADRLDAYTTELGIRGWYRHTDSHGKHRIAQNLLRLRADGDRGRYYSHAAAYMHQPLNHWVVDRDTGRTVYRTFSGRIAQQWIEERERGSAT
ncbi:hypothetical protein [Streptomyces sp. NPDC057677]|uniref:hypothetical protein n=1 Tax=unclassified Streptomyces TaxID=2593676 RepID=UPI0036BD9248